MKKKIALCLIVVVALIVVMAFAGCKPKPQGDVSLRDRSIPGFGAYTNLDNVIWNNTYKAEDWKTTSDMSDILGKSNLTAEDYNTLFQAFAVSNYDMVGGRAQMTVTDSVIDIELFQKHGILNVLTVKEARINQVSTWATINNGKGGTYERTISGMLELANLPNSIISAFGYWRQERTDSVEGKYQAQNGLNGSQKGLKTFDAEALGGVDCEWVGKPEDTTFETRIKKNETFDISELEFVSNPEAASARYDNVTISYDTSNGMPDQEVNYVDGRIEDESQYKVIKVSFKGSAVIRRYKTDENGVPTDEYVDEPVAGKEDITIDEFYCWDEVEQQYTSFVTDAHGVCIVGRNTGLANFVITPDTIDTTKSGIEVKTDNGKTYYEISFGLKAGGKYETIDEVCKGELKSMQAGTKGTVDFAANYTTFNDDITLVLSVWDNGLLKEFYREYSFHTGESQKTGQYCTVLADDGSRGQADVKNTQKQVFGYDEAILNQISGFTRGGLTFVQRIIVIAVVVVVVIVALIVTLVVLAKKGIIGKKARARRKAAKQAAEEGQLIEGADGEVSAEDKPAVEEDKKDDSAKE